MGFPLYGARAWWTMTAATCAGAVRRKGETPGLAGPQTKYVLASQNDKRERDDYHFEIDKDGVSFNGMTLSRRDCAALRILLKDAPVEPKAWEDHWNQTRTRPAYPTGQEEQWFGPVGRFWREDE